MVSGQVGFALLASGYVPLHAQMALVCVQTVWLPPVLQVAAVEATVVLCVVKPTTALASGSVSCSISDTASVCSASVVAEGPSVSVLRSLLPPPEAGGQLRGLPTATFTAHAFSFSGASCVALKRHTLS